MALHLLFILNETEKKTKSFATGILYNVCLID